MMEAYFYLFIAIACLPIIFCGLKAFQLNRKAMKLIDEYLEQSKKPEGSD